MYMSKQDLGLNNLQCYKPQPNPKSNDLIKFV